MLKSNLLLVFAVFFCDFVTVNACNSETEGATDFTVYFNTTSDEVPCEIIGVLTFEGHNPEICDFEGVTSVGAIKIECTSQVVKFPHFPDLVKLARRKMFSHAWCYKQDHPAAVDIASIFVQRAFFLESVDNPFPSLEGKVGGSIVFLNNRKLERVRLDTITSVPKNLKIVSNQNLKTVSFMKVAEATDISINHNDKLNVLLLPQLYLLDNLKFDNNFNLWYEGMDLSAMEKGSIAGAFTSRYNGDGFLDGAGTFNEYPAAWEEFSSRNKMQGDKFSTRY